MISKLVICDDNSELEFTVTADNFGNYLDQPIITVEIGDLSIYITSPKQVEQLTSFLQSQLSYMEDYESTRDIDQFCKSKA